MNIYIGNIIKFLGLAVLVVSATNTFALNQWKEGNYYMAGFLVVVDEGEQYVKYRSIRPSKGKKPSEYEEYWLKIEVKTNSNTQTVLPLSSEAINMPSQGGIIPANEIELLPEISVDVDKLPLIDTTTPGLLKEEGTVPDLYKEEDSSGFGLPSFNEVETESPTVVDGDVILWRKEKRYSKGDRASLNDKLYEARWSNVNHKPGITEAWIISREVGKTYFWEKDHIYPEPDFEVIYDGKVYKNTRWTLGDTPLPLVDANDDKEQPWVFVRDSALVKGAPWVANIKYAWTNEKASTVIYNGFLYQNRWGTIAEIPGNSDAWILVADPDKKHHWKADHVYPVSGAEVFFEDALYVNTRWTKGDIPGKDLAVWSKLKNTDANWDKNVYYEKGKVVSFNDHLYESLWAAAGQVPGQSEAWSLSADLGHIYAWQANHTYPVAGTTIEYKNEYYINAGRSRNDIPDSTDIWVPSASLSNPNGADDPITPNPITPEPITPEPITPDPGTPEPETPEPETPPIETSQCSQPAWVSATPYVVGDIVTANCDSPFSGTPCYNKEGLHVFRCIEQEGTEHCDLINPGGSSFNIWEIVKECG